MGYGNKIIEEAFSWYTTGISFDEVADQVKKKYPDQCARLTRQTIATWERKYNWEARKDIILQKSQEKADAKRISKRAELINELESLQDTLLKYTKAMVPKSLEGAVNSYLAVIRKWQDLRGDDQGKLSGKDLDSVISVIFEVLSEDEKIGGLLADRQEFILEKIGQRLEEK